MLGLNDEHLLPRAVVAIFCDSRHSVRAKPATVRALSGLIEKGCLQHPGESHRKQRILIAAQDLTLQESSKTAVDVGSDICGVDVKRSFWRDAQT